MASLDSERQFSHFARHRAEQREARLIFMLAYPFCLVAAVAKRLSPKRARAPRPAPAHAARCSARPRPLRAAVFRSPSGER